MEDRFKYRVWNIHARCMYPIEHFGLTCAGEQLQWFDGLMDNRMFGVNENGSMIYMQCTGLKDKHNELIFEGDILKRSKKRGSEIKVVEWESKHFCNAGWNIGPKLGYRDKTGWEIIGNIYENSELLKK